MIQFTYVRTDLPELNEGMVRAWIRKVAAWQGKTAGDITFMFCDDEKILEVNQQYLQHDYYTDIITFDYSTGSVISGDLVISVDTVATNSIQFNTNFEQELHRVIIHGVLHLCGYDDGTPELRAAMTQLENEALQLFYTL